MLIYKLNFSGKEDRNRPGAWALSSTPFSTPFLSPWLISEPSLCPGCLFLSRFLFLAVSQDIVLTVNTSINVKTLQVPDLNVYTVVNFLFEITNGQLLWISRRRLICNLMAGIRCLPSQWCELTYTCNYIFSQYHINLSYWCKYKSHF